VSDRPGGHVIPVISGPGEPVPKVCGESCQVRAEAGELVENLRGRHVLAAAAPVCVPVAGARGSSGRQQRLCHARNSSGRAVRPCRDTRTAILAVTAGPDVSVVAATRPAFDGRTDLMPC
jgi:hypothetical protein